MRLTRTRLLNSVHTLAPNNDHCPWRHACSHTLPKGLLGAGVARLLAPTALSKGSSSTKTTNSSSLLSKLGVSVTLTD